MMPQSGEGTGDRGGSARTGEGVTIRGEEAEAREIESCLRINWQVNRAPVGAKTSSPSGERKWKSLGRR